MAKAGLIPSYFVGTAKRGVRFKVDEVLAALRRPPSPSEPEQSKL